MKHIFFIVFLTCFLISCTQQKHKINNSGKSTVLIESAYIKSSKTLKIEKKANWNDVPNIIICDNSTISFSRVNNALIFWKNLNYNFGQIIRQYCPPDSEFIGSIYIMDPISNNINDKIAANTNTIYNVFNNGHKEIIGAWIEIPNSVTSKQLILEHEIGHALGFQHTSKKYHIMNKELTKSGTNTEGLNFNLH